MNRTDDGCHTRKPPCWCHGPRKAEPWGQKSRWVIPGAIPICWACYEQCFSFKDACHSLWLRIHLSTIFPLRTSHYKRLEDPHFVVVWLCILMYSSMKSFKRLLDRLGRLDWIWSNSDTPGILDPHALSTALRSETDSLDLGTLGSCSL